MNKVETFDINNAIHAVLFNINANKGQGIPVAVVWDRNRTQGIVVLQLLHGMEARRFSIEDGKVYFLKAVRKVGQFA